MKDDQDETAAKADVFWPTFVEFLFTAKSWWVALCSEFDLTPAEAGHPSWTKTFAAAKAQARKMQAEKAQKEAKEKAAKDKAGGAQPTAPVPKKN